MGIITRETFKAIFNLQIKIYLANTFTFMKGLSLPVDDSIKIIVILIIKLIDPHTNKFTG